jgi:hypothetical protein
MRLRGSYGGGKIPGWEGGSRLTQAFLRHVLIQEGEHDRIGLYSLHWPAASSPLAAGFSFTTVCDDIALDSISRCLISMTLPQTV